MICKSCGTELEENVKFCTECGAPVSTDTDVPAEEIEVVEDVVIEAPGEEPADVVADSSEGSVDYSGDPTFAAYETAAGISSGGSAIVVSVMSLVCGILSILCCCFSIFSVLSAIAGIVLGAISLRRKFKGRGMAIAGIICSAFGLVIGIFFIVTAATSATIDFEQPFNIDIEDFI